MNKKALIETLNGLVVGEFSRIQSRLVEVREQLGEAGAEEIVTILDEAKTHLDAFDLKAYRKKIQHAVSRIGHLKDGSSLSTKLPPHIRR